MSIIFVTGATGVIGRATVPKLLAAGYSVRALSRSAANDATIRDLGAVPVRATLFDLESLQEAVAGTDAILHLATRIPPASRMRRRESWVENDRIRSEGTRNLVDVAIETGARTVVYPSVVFVYPDYGSAWIDAASTPVDPSPLLRSTIAAEDAVLRFGAEGAAGQRRGIVLRFGALYAPDDALTVEQLTFATRGFSVYGSSPDAYVPMLWVEDAATALQAALARAPSGVYDVVDDEPIRQRQLASALAAAVGRRHMLSLPNWLVRRMSGIAGSWLLQSRRVSNRRFREAAGWAPSVPNAIAGIGRVAERRRPQPRRHVLTPIRIGLWVLFLSFLGAGIRQRFVAGRSER